jgi:hypothetical protein
MGHNNIFLNVAEEHTADMHLIASIAQERDRKWYRRVAISIR